MSLLRVVRRSLTSKAERFPLCRSRSLWRFGAAALASAPGLLIPTAAPASKGACSVQLEGATRHVTAGETVTLSGSVVCAGSSQASEQTVTIYRHSVGTPGTSVLGTATPEANGAFHFTTEALEADSVLYARVEGDRGARISVQVAPRVTISATPAGTQLSIGARRAPTSSEAVSTVTFTGTVSPEEAGRRLVLERANASVEFGWHEVAVGEVAADGSYSITHRFGIPGDAFIRIVVPANRMFLAGVSEPLSYQIARHQNAKPAIKGSASSPTAAPSEPPTAH